MSTYQLILTHKNKSEAIWDNNIHTQKCFWGNIVVILHSYGDRANFLLFYDDLDNEYN